MSGFLRGAERALGELMRSCDEGRVLFLGICLGGLVFGHVVVHDSPIAKAFDAACLVMNIAINTCVSNLLTHVS